MLNPDGWFGKTWLIELGGSYTPLFLVVEAFSLTDAIDVLSFDETYGHQIHVKTATLKTTPRMTGLRQQRSSHRHASTSRSMGVKAATRPFPSAITAMDCPPRASTLDNSQLGIPTDTARSR